MKSPGGKFLGYKHVTLNRVECRRNNSPHFSPPLAGYVFFGRNDNPEYTVKGIYQTHTGRIPDASRDKHETYTTYIRRIHDASSASRQCLMV
ncbi:hypothetical protein SAMN04488121_10975 [Chitinophaga filiformis]|uniref:Uncharacterized protein n=1 Tax=Chitinophaga filiformis TaxID=104663 RepID=A0A1G8A0N7_CHIFI|nr:hypothetical protein SAMN04488121_10975 [Chitinophaga filiformis]